MTFGAPFINLIQRPFGGVDTEAETPLRQPHYTAQIKVRPPVIIEEPIEPIAEPIKVVTK